LAAWWADQSFGDWFAPLASKGSVDPGFLLKNLPWFTWPVLPLVLWALWTRGRGFNGGLAVPAVQLPGTLALVIVAAIAVMSEPRVIYLMPLLLPLALLGALEIDTLKRGFSGALDWFGILTFGLTALLMWVVWIDAYLNGMPMQVARLFRDTESGYRPSFHLGSTLVALALTILWVVLVRPARRSNRRAILNWAAGVTLIWGLVTTIWLPYLDSRRSYRWTVEAVAKQLPAQGCVASRHLGEPQRALFNYFAGIKTVREEVRPKHDCTALLVQYGRVDGTPEPPPGWTAKWSGARRGDDTERFVLYVKSPR
jgi:4-amino-4-deoxy-L-arabinose transferase-like glycosyltransferase